VFFFPDNSGSKNKIKLISQAQIHANSSLELQQPSADWKKMHLTFFELSGHMSGMCQFEN